MRHAAYFALASGLLHAVGLLIVRNGVEPAPRAQAATIELSIVALARSAPAERGAEVPAAVMRAEPPAVHRRAARSTPPVTQSVQLSAAAPSEAPATAPVPAAERPFLAVDLSPQRAASALPDPAEACSTHPAKTGTDQCQQPQPGDVAQRALNASLNEAANSPEYRRHRAPPQLRREGDGGYSFHDPVFVARIYPDGRVEFVDRATVHVDGFVGLAIWGSFDLTDMIERNVLHKEIYSAEKQWFLEQTAALRQRLQATAHAEEGRTRAVDPSHDPSG